MKISVQDLVSKVPCPACTCAGPHQPQGIYGHTIYVECWNPECLHDFTIERVAL